MSTESSSGTDRTTNEALATDLVRLRDALTTPEAVGRALTYFVLTEAVRRGKQIDANTFELPMTVTTTIERPATDSGSASQPAHHTMTETCVHHALEVFGVEVVAWTTCTSHSGSVH